MRVCNPSLGDSDRLHRETGLVSAPSCAAGTRASSRKDAWDTLSASLASRLAEVELNSVNLTASFISLSVKVLSPRHPITSDDC